MPAIIEHIDAIARKKQRAVLSVNYCFYLYFSFVRSVYATRRITTEHN